MINKNIPKGMFDEPKPPKVVNTWVSLPGSKSITVTTGNLLVLMSHNQYNCGDTPATTYNGVQMSKQWNFDFGVGANASVWYLANPTPGTHTVYCQEQQVRFYSVFEMENVNLANPTLAWTKKPNGDPAPTPSWVSVAAVPGADLICHGLLWRGNNENSADFHFEPGVTQLQSYLIAGGGTRRLSRWGKLTADATSESMGVHYTLFPTLIGQYIISLQ